MKHIVLIHGAWQGSWVWTYLIPELEQRGWTVHAVDLPGTLPLGHAPSLEKYVAICQVALSSCPGPAVVVGHSGGAVVAAQVAECFPERISLLVLLAGIMLPSDVSFAEVIENARSSGADVVAGIEPFLEWSEDRTVSVVPRSAAAGIFLHDCAAERVAFAAERLCPQHEAGRAMRPAFTGERFGNVRRVYIEAENDRSISLRVQRYMQEIVPGSRRITMATGHCPQIAQPVQLANILDGLS
jgi:pimeloyl-ACP methyl ester carboxylesterase